MVVPMPATRGLFLCDRPENEEPDILFLTALSGSSSLFPSREISDMLDNKPVFAKVIRI